MIRPAVVTSVVFAVALGATPKPARGADWTVEPRAASRLGATSNVELERDREEDADWGPMFEAGGRYGARTSHLEAATDFSGSYYRFLEHPGKSDLRFGGTAVGRGRAFDDRLGLDLEAFYDEVFTDPLGTRTRSGFNDTPDRRSVHAFRVQPYAAFALKDLAALELRYAFSDVGVEDNPDSKTHGATVLLSSGSRAQRVSWVATGAFEDSDRREEGRDAGDARRYLGSLDLRMPLGGQFALTAGGGFERIRDSDLDDTISGGIATGGFEFRPNPRLSFRTNAGYRFERFTWSAALESELGARTELHADYDESVQTSQRLLRTGLGFLGVEPNGSLIDTRTERRLVIGDPAFGLARGTFLRRRAALRVTREGARSSGSVQLFRESREFDLEDRSERAFGLATDVAHNLTRKLRIDVGGEVYAIDFGPSLLRRRDRVALAAAGLKYKVNSRFSVGTRYFFADRDSNRSAANFGEHAGLIEFLFVMDLSQRDETLLTHRDSAP